MTLKFNQTSTSVKLLATVDGIVNRRVSVNCQRQVTAVHVYNDVGPISLTVV